MHCCADLSHLEMAGAPGELCISCLSFHQEANYIHASQKVKHVLKQNKSPMVRVQICCCIHWSIVSRMMHCSRALGQAQAAGHGLLLATSAYCYTPFERKVNPIMWMWRRNARLSIKRKHHNANLSLVHKTETCLWTEDIVLS